MHRVHGYDTDFLILDCLNQYVIGNNSSLTGLPGHSIHHLKWERLTKCYKKVTATQTDRTSAFVSQTFWCGSPCKKFPHVRYRAEFGCFRSNGPSILPETRRKVLTPHILPFQVKQGHRNRHWSIGYLSLITVTMRPPCYVFQMNDDFGQNSQIFLTPCIYLAPPLIEFPLECYFIGWARKKIYTVMTLTV